MGTCFVRPPKTSNFCAKLIKTMNVNDEDLVIFEEFADSLIQDSEALEVVEELVYCRLCSLQGEEVCVEGVDFMFDDDTAEEDDVAEEAIEAYNEDASSKMESSQAKAWKEVLPGVFHENLGLLIHVLDGCMSLLLYINLCIFDLLIY